MAPPAPCTKHKSSFTKTPPTLEFVTQNYPYILPNEKLDRTIPRCKLCDLIAAQERATIAENPPPGINVEDEIEENIKNIEEMIAADIATKQDKEDLRELSDELEMAIRLTDLRIHEAWLPYWEIWGPGDGPEKLLDTAFDDGEDLIDWGDGHDSEELLKPAFDDGEYLIDCDN